MGMEALFVLISSEITCINLSLRMKISHKILFRLSETVSVKLRDYSLNLLRVRRRKPEILIGQEVVL